MLLERVLVVWFCVRALWHRACPHMEWALVSCMTCFSKGTVKMQGWISVWLQTESWGNPVSEIKENMAGLSEFLPCICVLCPPIPVKLWIEKGIKSYTTQFYGSCLFWQGMLLSICFLLTLLVIIFHFSFSLTLRVTMIFIWACIFVRAPNCSLFLITDHVAYIIAVVAVESI